MSEQVPQGTCLQCGETREWVKRHQASCGGVDYWGELTWELPRHRWADWTDRDFDRWGILPEHRDQHRRTDIWTLDGLSCDLRTREHDYVKGNPYGPVPDEHQTTYCRHCFDSQDTHPYGATAPTTQHTQEDQ